MRFWAEGMRPFALFCLVEWLRNVVLLPEHFWVLSHLFLVCFKKPPNGILERTKVRVEEDKSEVEADGIV